MKRDIKIKVTGTQYISGESAEPEVIELYTTGKYFEKDGMSYIKYDEVMAEVEEPVKNLLKFDENMLQVTKSGGVGTVMFFDKDKSSTAHYITPLGPLDMNIITESYHRTERDDGMTLDVKYLLDYSFGCVLDCRLNVEAEYMGASHE